MKHELPLLPYGYDGLEPGIDERTLRVHHDEHHQGYVNGLNSAEEKLSEARQVGDYSLIKHWERELAFHGSGHILHSLYWENMSPDGGEPGGEFADHVEDSFGGIEPCIEQFLAASGAVEGSGWGCLAYRPGDEELVILQVENHQNLTQWGVHPLLVADVWEHAYYLKYQNRCKEYLENFIRIADWGEVESRYDDARRCGAQA
ncbi:MAG: Superoxide dismutase [Fe] [Methanonatronarchaeales archaeon]|nr:Superoxide dismutase [Fe] [Methanonatronarchaeales archaeon]